MVFFFLNYLYKVGEVPIDDSPIQVCVVSNNLIIINNFERNNSLKKF